MCSIQHSRSAGISANSDRVDAPCKYDCYPRNVRASEQQADGGGIVVVGGIDADVGAGLNYHVAARTSIPYSIYYGYLEHVSSLDEFTYCCGVHTIIVEIRQAIADFSSTAVGRLSYRFHSPRGSLPCTRLND